MSTATTSGELIEFAQFITTHLHGISPPTAEEAVIAFREYQEQKERFLRESREAFEQAERGEFVEFDLEEAKRRVTERLAAKGIVD